MAPGSLWGSGWRLGSAFRRLADFLPSLILLPLSRRPGLESPTWLPGSPAPGAQCARSRLADADKWVCRSHSRRTWAPSPGQALDSLTGAWAAGGKIRPQSYVRLLSLRSSPHPPPPACVAATAAPPPRKGRGCGRGPCKSGGGGTVGPEQTEKVKIFLNRRLSLFLYLLLSLFCWWW